jgi:hypothetical protein
MDELMLIIAVIFIGLLAGLSEATYRAMVMVALLCIYYEVSRR